MDNNKKLGPGEYNPKFISVKYFFIRLLQNLVLTSKRENKNKKTINQVLNSTDLIANLFKIAYLNTLLDIKNKKIYKVLLQGLDNIMNIKEEKMI